jgi:hypothetical protein
MYLCHIYYTLKESQRNVVSWADPCREMRLERKTQNAEVGLSLAVYMYIFAP